MSAGSLSFFGGSGFGFEFFPPKNVSFDDSNVELEFSGYCDKINCNDSLRFVSVTSGASGSDKFRSIEFIAMLKKYLKKPIVAHLSCSNITKSVVVDILTEYVKLGLKFVLVVSGDKDQEYPMRQSAGLLPLL